MAGELVTIQEVTDVNRVKAAMATLKESYVASCKENQSLKFAQQHSKGTRPRNTCGVSKMPNLDAEGFKTLLNRNILEDGDESDKDDGNDDDVGANPSKRLFQA